MTVDFVYNLMKFVSSKNQNGYLSPSDFNTIINQAQYAMLDYLLGEFQTYQTGRPIPKVQYSQNEIARQRLTPFIKAPTSLTVDFTGFSQYPTDYQQTDAMYDATLNRIRYVQQHKLYSYLNSTIDPIATNPIYLIINNGFQFYPISIGAAKLSYVSTPPDIVWAFTLDGNGRPVYDPLNSVDPGWYNTDMLEIMGKAFKMLGINLQSQEISQYADQLKAVGQ